MRGVLIVLIILVVIAGFFLFKTPFYKYKTHVYTGTLTSLNAKISPKEAVMFRTAINDVLSQTGINFAGKYSLVYVGMTGWGENYFMVDRTTGKATPVPMMIDEIESERDSSLLVIKSDDKRYKYLWNGSSFVPIGESAPTNPFWSEYFRN